MAPELPTPIRNWRVTEAEPFGLHVWFDPRSERVEIVLLEVGMEHPGEVEGNPGEGAVADEYYPGGALDTKYQQDNLPF